MISIDAIIILEHTSRELEFCVLLKKYLCNKGLSCELVSYDFSKRKYQLLYRPKILILPFLYDNKDVKDLIYPFQSQCDWEIKVFNLHQEQVGSSSNISLMMPSGNAINCYHIAWGRNFRNSLIKYGVNSNLIEVTGNPRLDFYKPNLSIFSYSRKMLAKELNICPEKKWLLFVSSFSMIEIEDSLVHDLFKRGYLTIETFKNLSEKTYEICIEWFQKFCKENNDIEFIYRPHPSEKISTKLRALQNITPNFHIISKYSIRNWIINSDYCTIWISTSVVEAFVANVKPIILRPVEIPQEIDNELFTGVSSITSYNDFLRTIKNDNNKKIFYYDKLIENINQHYYLPKEYSFKLIAEWIYKEGRCISKNYNNKNRIFILLLLLKFILEVFRNILFHFGILNKIVSDNILCVKIFGRKKNYDNYFSKYDILRIERKYDKIFK